MKKIIYVALLLIEIFIGFAGCKSVPKNQENVSSKKIIQTDKPID